MSALTVAEKLSLMSNKQPAIGRLGLPYYDWESEGSHGVARAGRATVFPSPIMMAATFSASISYRAGRVVSMEGRGKFNDYVKRHGGNNTRWYSLDFLAPNINLFLHPLWGRGQETYGEDPFLTAEMGAQYVLGIQNWDPSNASTAYVEAGATCKVSERAATHSAPAQLGTQRCSLIRCLRVCVILRSTSSATVIRYTRSHPSTAVRRLHSCSARSLRLISALPRALAGRPLAGLQRQRDCVADGHLSDVPRGVQGLRAEGQGQVAHVRVRTKHTQARHLPSSCDRPHRLRHFSFTRFARVCSYSTVNGYQSCEHPALQHVVRDEWGFTGFICSDAGAVGLIPGRNNSVKAAIALRAGVDQDLDGGEYSGLAQALQLGWVHEADLDTALLRVFRERIRTGQLDPPELVPYSAYDLSVVDMPASRAVARQAAREGTVLLKNEGGLLPIDLKAPSLKNIAVVGPNADRLYTLLGVGTDTAAEPLARDQNTVAVFSPAAALCCPLSELRRSNRAAHACAVSCYPHRTAANPLMHAQCHCMHTPQVARTATDRIRPSTRVVCSSLRSPPYEKPSTPPTPTRPATPLPSPSPTSSAWTSTARCARASQRPCSRCELRMWP